MLTSPSLLNFWKFNYVLSIYKFMINKENQENHKKNLNKKKFKIIG